MQARKRYFLVFFVIVISLSLYNLSKIYQLLITDSNHEFEETFSVVPRLSFVTYPSVPSTIAVGAGLQRDEHCRMYSCFNFTACLGDFPKVYVYPDDDSLIVSESYAKILAALRSSHRATADPSKACLKVLAFDSLDRDRLSDSYVRGFQSLLDSLDPTLWDEGRNHVIFNLFSGTWPNYGEHDLLFQPSHAILAKASFSLAHFRHGFDVALPLFQKEIPLKDNIPAMSSTRLNFPPCKKFNIAFKGKRYVFGIGSEARNSLHHLHNHNSSIVLTTCKHGKDWQKLQDDRCEADNALYDRWDYDTMLNDASFCIIPRGRRHGSFRFLEALKAGCIPVILSNSWELPFSEVIDWRQAVLLADERLLFQISDLVHSISAFEAFRMQQQCILLYRRYFSSVEKIIGTTIEIILDRVKRWQMRSVEDWNGAGIGGLRMNTASMDNDSMTGRSYCTAVVHFPLLYSRRISGILSKLPSMQIKILKRNITTSAMRILATVSRMEEFNRIILLPFSYGALGDVIEEPDPAKMVLPSARWFASKLQSIGKKLVVIDTIPNNATQSHPVIAAMTSAPPGGCVALIDGSHGRLLSVEHFRFALAVHRDLPDRLLGFRHRSHFWGSHEGRYIVTSRMLNYYSNLQSDSSVLLFRRNWLDLLARGSSHRSTSKGENLNAVREKEDQDEDVGGEMKAGDGEDEDGAPAKDNNEENADLNVEMKNNEEMHSQSSFVDSRGGFLNSILSNSSFGYECFDLALNFIIADYGSAAPILLKSNIDSPDYFAHEQHSFLWNFLNATERMLLYRDWNRCLELLSTARGQVLLIRTKVSFGPVLFRDDVSSYRKHYKMMEVV